MRRTLSVLVALLAVATSAVAQTTTFTIPPGTLMPPVVVFPASAVNGAGVVTAPQVLFPNGSLSAPSIASATTPGLGLFFPNAFTIGGAGGGVASLGVVLGAAGFVQQNAAGKFGWSATTDGTAAADTTLARAAAGQITYTSVAFAALATPANGTIAFCSDCAPTTPATCPGTKASCVCTSGGVGSLAIRANALWYCPF